MKKLITMITLLCLLATLCSCGKSEEPVETAPVESAEEVQEVINEEEVEVEPAKEEEPVEEPTPEPEVESVNCDINKAYPFAEDRAWVEYSDPEDNATCTALIDTDGNVLFSEKEKVRNISSMQGGVSVVQLMVNDGPKKYLFVDKDGNLTCTFTSEDDDSELTVIGQYQDKILVMDEKSGFSGHTADIYTVDKDGSKSTDTLLSFGIKDQDSLWFYKFSDDNSLALWDKYVGYLDFSTRRNCISKLGKCLIAYREPDDSSFRFALIDIVSGSSKLYGNSRDESGNVTDYGLDLLNINSRNIFDTDKGIYLYGFNAQGERVYVALDDIEDFDARSFKIEGSDDKKTITSDGKIVVAGETTISVYDIADGSLIAESPDMGGEIYTPGGERWFQSGSGFCAILLKGADGDTYVSVLDDKLSQLYEPQPMKANEWDLCNGYVIFNDEIGARNYAAYTPAGQKVSLKDGDDVSGISSDSVSTIGDKEWFLSDGYFNISAVGGEDCGYRSTNGSMNLTETIVSK